MGVHGLWDIVGPTARPVRLEALSRRKLAVDASIWIYQFLKAVRDKEGNALRNSHIVGFFRRICKLLYFGIFPVFVFDGGAPVLKRATITKRKERREGKKETIQQAAQRILAAQLQKHADERSKAKTQSNRASPTKRASKEIPKENLQFLEYYEDYNYLDGTTQSDSQTEVQEKNVQPRKETQSERVFRGEDEYHLPYLEKIKKDLNDNRVMEDEEYHKLTEDLQDDLVGIDLDKIDPKSPEFGDLPLETQYIVLSHLRLRSRLRAGLTKNQLQEKFPNSMEFSKFQIANVQKRNFLTQKLMKASGMDNTDATERRIAGQRDRHYTLQKNENGYSLSIEGNGISKVKDEDMKSSNVVKIEDDDSEEDFEWEDVETSEAKPLKNQQPHFESKSFLDPSIHGNNDKPTESLFVMDEVTKTANGEPESEEETEEYKMALVKSLYEYARENNSNVKFTDPEANKHDEELRRAIEISKAEYENLENQISSGTVAPDEIKESKVPLIFSKLTLRGGIFDGNSQAKKIDSVSSKNQLGLGDLISKPETGPVIDIDNEIEFEEGDVAKVDDEMPKEVKSGDQVSKTASSKKPPSMPQWFSNNGNFRDFSTEIGVERKSADVELSADEKLGLMSYRDYHDFVDSDNEKESVHELIELDETPSPEVFPVDENSPPKVQLVEDNKSNEIQEETVDDEFDDELFEDVVVAEDKLPKEAVSVTSGTHGFSAQYAADILKPGKPSGDGVSENVSEKEVSYMDYEFSEDEEEQFARQLEDEDIAYDKFVDQLGGNGSTHATTSTSLWNLEKEKELQEQRNKDKRDADEVTAGMITDVQDLLSRFGIPFITAPMEAEAQCAELYRLGLVDGIITDDSDCFLFGGGKIYKNMFSDKNVVECYFASDIERDLGLTRDKMIELAYLLGSDYTEGLKGIGAVNAMEILAEFVENEEEDKNVIASGTLLAFKDWWMNYQNGGKIDENETTYKTKLRKKLKANNLFLETHFPDPLIYDAYIKPEVDSDKTEFKWGTPNLDRLRTFLMFTVGWNQEKVDEVLLPVIKDMNKKKNEGLQSTLGEFFPSEMIQKRKGIMRGKRLQDATSKLTSRSEVTKKRKTN